MRRRFSRSISVAVRRRICHEKVDCGVDKESGEDGE